MEPLALYIHWPFCLAKCPYCDFNSHVREAHRPAALRRRAPRRTGVGGGAARPAPPRLDLPRRRHPQPDGRRHRRRADRATPRACSTPRPTWRSRWRPIPTSVEAARLAEFRAAGVNRMSIGVQSLDPEALRHARPPALARREAIAALEIARRLFPRLSLRPDLRPPRPGRRRPGGAELRAALGARRRPSLALPAHHRARHALRDAAPARRDRAARPRHGRRALRGDRRRCRRASGCWPTRSPTTPARARRAATTSPTGATPTTPASVPARMGG